MMTIRKNPERDPYQDINRHFRSAHLVVSGGMLLCELSLLTVLLWRYSALTQAQVFMFLLVSVAVIMPLFLGYLRIRPLLHHRKARKGMINKKRISPFETGHLHQFGNRIVLDYIEFFNVPAHV